ncbi:MAG TPA: hypothetical protein VGA20_07240 [Gemmatimonadales bacterium]
MEEELLIVLVFGGSFALLFPLVRALADRIRRRSAETEARPELDRLRTELLDELQQLRQETSELTERVEFAERLLAKQREPDRLPRGG